jgi:hypothetical protein
MARTLGLLLLATPLTLIGCGDDNGSSNGKDGSVARLDGGKLDGAAAPADGGSLDTAGSRADAPGAIDQALSQPDGGAIDAPITADGATAQDTGSPILVDASVADTPVPVDALVSVDTLAPADGEAAVDGAPVGACTEATKFSGGLVNADRTLTKACSPYAIEESISVANGATLTIEPGTTLAFAGGKDLSAGPGSTLDAIGTASDPIVLTSSKSVPAKGDWAGLTFRTGATITVKYATVQYAGNQDTYAIDARASSFDMENCTIEHNLRGGLDGTGARNSILKDNTFSDNNANGTTVLDWTIPDFTNTVSGNVSK